MSIRDEIFNNLGEASVSISSNTWSLLGEKIEKEKNIDLEKIYPNNSFVPIDNGKTFFVFDKSRCTQTIKICQYFCVLTQKVAYGIIHDNKLLKDLKILDHNWLLTSVVNKQKKYTCKKCKASGVGNNNNKAIHPTKAYLTCKEHQIKEVLL